MAVGLLESQGDEEDDDFEVLTRDAFAPRLRHSGSRCHVYWTMITESLRQLGIRFGWRATRNGLFFLNAFYILLGMLLLMVAVWAARAARVSSVGVLGAVGIVGSLLIAVAALGLYGASRQHQVALFFYMLVLGALFVVQVLVAVTSLSASESSIEQGLATGWNSSSSAVLWDLQKALQCCGWKSAEDATVNCKKLDCWTTVGCGPCGPQLSKLTMDNVRSAGTLGFFFAFSELAGIWMARHYRNLRDPRFARQHPSPFM